MFFYEGYICPVCKKKFLESDDIVACPDCGAPHHRECWKQEGHCHFAADHGTPQQWKHPADNVGTPAGRTDAYQPGPGPAYGSTGPRPSANNPSVPGGPRICPHCGQQNPEYAEFCSHCGQSLPPSEWTGMPNSQQHTNQSYNSFPGNYGNYGEYSPFHMPVMDPYGGVAHDEKIKDVSAEDLVTFIGPNSSYYLPRAVRMERSGSHLSWNWAAFFFTPYWLLYRKNYLWGSVALALNVVQTFLSTFIMEVYIDPLLDTTSYSSMTQSFQQALTAGKISNIYLYILTLLVFSDILVRVIFGLVSNSLYLRTAISRIKKIRDKSSEGVSLGQNVYDQVGYHHDLVTNGGISLILVAVAAGIAWFGQILVQTLFVYKF